MGKDIFILNRLYFLFIVMRGVAPNLIMPPMIWCKDWKEFMEQKVLILDVTFIIFFKYKHTWWWWGEVSGEGSHPQSFAWVNIDNLKSLVCSLMN